MVELSNVVPIFKVNHLYKFLNFLSPEFVHYFSKMEVEKELEEANFKMTFYGDEFYGHAVGQKIE